MVGGRAVGGRVVGGFPADAITFVVQGVKQDANQIGISTTDNKQFTLDMSTMNSTLPNGYYTLTVQTAGITDAEGYKGKDGKQVSWILFRGGLVQLLTSAWPLNSGTIDMVTETAGTRAMSPQRSPSDKSARYGSVVTFTATAENGYEFSNWTLNGEVVGTQPTFTTTALSDMNVVANFKPKSYRVEITATVGGSVSGAGTGIYDFGTELQLTASPQIGYRLKEWLIDGATVLGASPSSPQPANPLTLTVDGAKTVQAVFEPKPAFIPGDANGDGQVTTFDITKVVSYILTGDAEGINLEAVDMNGDGNITTFDVTQIVKLIVF